MIKDALTLVHQTKEKTVAQYWYNVETHEVEKDAQSNWQKLIGPYDSQAEAESALAKVRERNEAADAYDEEDED